jgi:hypothetical protein
VDQALKRNRIVLLSKPEPESESSDPIPESESESESESGDIMFEFVTMSGSKYNWVCDMGDPDADKRQLAWYVCAVPFFFCIGRLLQHPLLFFACNRNAMTKNRSVPVDVESFERGYRLVQPTSLVVSDYITGKSNVLPRVAVDKLTLNRCTIDDKNCDICTCSLFFCT